MVEWVDGWSVNKFNVSLWFNFRFFFEQDRRVRSRVQLAPAYFDSYNYMGQKAATSSIHVYACVGCKQAGKKLSQSNVESLFLTKSTVSKPHAICAAVEEEIACWLTSVVCFGKSQRTSERACMASNAKTWLANKRQSLCLCQCDLRR